MESGEGMEGWMVGSLDEWKVGRTMKNLKITIDFSLQDDIIASDREIIGFDKSFVRLEFAVRRSRPLLFA